jgi:hypothetical protein
VCVDTHVMSTTFRRSVQLRYMYLFETAVEYSMPIHCMYIYLSTLLSTPLRVVYLRTSYYLAINS